MPFFLPAPQESGIAIQPQAFPVNTAVTYPNFQDARYTLPDLSPVYEGLNELLGAYKKKDLKEQQDAATRLFGYAAQESQGSIDTLRKLVSERGLLSGSNPAFIARTHELYAERLAQAYQADLMAGMSGAAQIQNSETGQLSPSEVTSPVKAFAT